MVEGNFTGGGMFFHPAFRFCKGFAWCWWKQYINTPLGSACLLNIVSKYKATCPINR
jgi:hypothetical protein